MSLSQEQHAPSSFLNWLHKINPTKGGKSMKKQHRITSLLAVLIILMVVFFTGCASTGGVQSPAKMTPMQLSTWANNIYIYQFDSYVAEVRAGSLTKDQVKILNIKKKILIELKPALRLYSLYVDEGKAPTADMHLELISLIDRLLLEVIK